MPDLLERGSIFVVNQPAVADRTNGPAWTYLVFSVADQPRFRRMVVGRQRIRMLRGGTDRLWGFVDRVADNFAAMEAEFDLSRYQAPGTRSYRPEPCGGFYLLVSRITHTFLIYSLGADQEPGRLEPEASYIMAVKNPAAGRPADLGWQPRHEPDLPRHLREEFHGRRFRPAHPELLNWPGLEVLLVRKNRPRRAHIALDPREPYTSSAEIFNSLRAKEPAG